MGKEKFPGFGTICGEIFQLRDDTERHRFLELRAIMYLCSKRDDSFSISYICEKLYTLLKMVDITSKDEREECNSTQVK